MDKSAYGFQRVYWDDVRDKVKIVNPQLAEIIDKISPNKNYPLIKATYRFGDLIIKQGVTYLPSENGILLPAEDIGLQKILKDQLSYSAIPLFLTLKNANEVFIDTSSRIIPLNLFYPGSLLGLFESVDYIFNRVSPAKWNVSAGARSLFLLSKINEIGGFKRLKIAYGLDPAIQPRSLADHWRVFYEIARHKYFEQSWKNEILFFTKSWLVDHYKDPKWFAFRDYLFKNAWHQAQFAISKINLNLTWEYFVQAISARNLRPGPYFIDQFKHIMLVAAGRWPGFKPADASNQIAPTDCLQEAITEIYMLKKHLPTMMHISSLEHDMYSSAYYSLSYPTLLEGLPYNNQSASTIMEDLREIKQLIDVIEPIFINPKKIGTDIFSKVKLECFHVEQDKYSKIKLSNELQNLDKCLLSDKNKFPGREFCATSQFWRGCIRISRKQ